MSKPSSLPPPKFTKLQYYGGEPEGDVMSFEDFKACCDSGGITDNDGSGVWMKGDEVSDVYLESSDFDLLKPPSWATQVCWYNK